MTTLEAALTKHLNGGTMPAPYHLKLYKLEVNGGGPTVEHVTVSKPLREDELQPYLDAWLNMSRHAGWTGRIEVWTDDGPVVKNEF